MKKTLLTLGAVLSVSAGAFAQGSVTFETAKPSPGVAVEQWNPDSASGFGTAANDWYNGSLTLEVFYAPGSDSNAANEVAAINAAEEAGGNYDSGATLALLAGDTDFTLETFANASSGTLGPENESVTVACSDGVFDTTVDLPNVPSESNAYWILLGYAAIGGEPYLGLVGLDNMSTGAPGAPEDDYVAWQAAAINLDLATDFVPEPTTLALAGLGGLTMLLLRRRKA